MTFTLLLIIAYTLVSLIGFVYSVRLARKVRYVQAEGKKRGVDKQLRKIMNKRLIKYTTIGAALFMTLLVGIEALFFSGSGLGWVAAICLLLQPAVLTAYLIYDAATDDDVLRSAEHVMAVFGKEVKDGES